MAGDCVAKARIPPQGSYLLRRPVGTLSRQACAAEHMNMFEPAARDDPCLL